MEDNFYIKYNKIRKSEGLKWEAFGKVLDKSGDAIRMAFTKESLKPFEKDIIETNFGEKKSKSLDDLSIFIAENFDEIIKNALVEKEIELRSIKKASYWISNPDKFNEYLNS